MVDVGKEKKNGFAIETYSEMS